MEPRPSSTRTPHWDDLRRQLKELRWLGSLASRLVVDPNVAEDACQEAWMTVQTSKRAALDDSGRRVHLVRALRRFLWRRQRSESRRRDRERGVAQGEALPPTSELILRGEQRERLWSHLKGLDEPYRSTLLLRFQEDLETLEIASRQGIPRDTVRWRIRRGLELLRESLGADTEGGGLPALAFALPLGSGTLSGIPSIPLALGNASSSTATSVVGLGVLGMSKSLLLATLSVLLLLAGLATWLGTGDGETATRDRVGEERVAVETVDPTEPETLNGFLDSSHPVRTQAVVEAPPNTMTASEGLAILVGRVLDADGFPLVGVWVGVREGERWEQEGASDAEGRFRIETPLQVEDEVEVTVRATRMHEELRHLLGTTSDCVAGPLMDVRDAETDLGDLVLAGAGVLRGRLVDGEGLGFGGASIYIKNTGGSAVSDGTGGFEVGHVLPGRHGYSINARGHLDLEGRTVVEVGAVTDLGELPLEAGPRVRGRVTDMEDRPLVDAKVSSRGFTRNWVFETDARGHFDIPMPDRKPCDIAARATGHIQSSGVAAEPGAEGVHLRLESRGVRCRFQVVDTRDGSPILRFGARIHRGADLPVDDPRYEDPWGSDPSPRERDEGRVEADARPGVDRFGFAAPGFMAKHVGIQPDALGGGDQVVRLTPAPGVRGRIVERGQAVSGQEVILQFGDLCVVQNLGADGSTVPLPADHPLKAALGAQWGYPMLGVWPIDEPLPPLRLGSIGTHPRYRRTLTDADGRFQFTDLEIGGVEVMASSKDGRRFVRSGILGFEAGTLIDLGDLEGQPSANLRGRLVPSGPGQLGGHGIVVHADRVHRVETDVHGSFELNGLPPGRHYLHVDPGEGLHAPRIGSQSFYVNLSAGETRDIDLEIRSHASCELSIAMTCNGKPIDGAHVSFDSDDPGFDGSSLDLDANGRGTVVIPAHVPLRGSLRLGGAGLQWGSDRDYPSGPFHLDVALETGQLEVRLPPGLEFEGALRASLDWTTASREPRGSLSGSLDPDRVPAEAGEGPVVLWKHVPVGAQDLVLVLDTGGPYREGEVLLREALSVQIEKGVRVRVDLD